MRRSCAVAAVSMSIALAFASPALAQKDPFNPAVDPNPPAVDQNVTADGTTTTTTTNTEGVTTTTNPPDVAAQVGSEALPNTGVDTLSWFALAYALILGGAALLIVSRLHLMGDAAIRGIRQLFT